MHEQAFLAKLRRMLMGLLVSLPSGHRAMRMFPLTPAEAAALNLRTAAKTAQADTAGEVTFAIPLVGAHQVGDWQTVDAAFTRTAETLIAQSDPNWRAIVCSQTRPSAVDLDARITHLPFDRNVNGHDKVAKLEQIIEHVFNSGHVSGTFMPLDGDDLLNLSFTHCAATTKQGLLVSDGYILDAGAHVIGRTSKRSPAALRQKPFWKFCGSCIALPVGQAPAVLEAAFWNALVQHEHRLYPYLAKLAGFRPHASETALALYVINHGENFENRRGRGGFKQRFAKRFQVVDQARLDDIFTAFPAARSLINPRTNDL